MANCTTIMTSGWIEIVSYANKQMPMKTKILAVFLMTVALGVASTAEAQVPPRNLDSIISNLKLKEITVTAKKIVQKKDTVSYSASTYISKEDKSLSDLLKKMPGIEVTKSGKVVYNGKWVKDFYIEGANMLGDNYGIATKNLDARDIGTVQVMENHQAQKVKRGIETGDAPAINIRLKESAKNAWASTLDAAVGAQPKFSWDAALTLMKFSRKTQNISVYKTNNVGSDLRGEINAPTNPSGYLGTSLLLPGRPALSSDFSYRNSTHSGTVNRYYKISEDASLALNMNYLYDEEKQDAEEETAYLSDNSGTHVIRESNHAKVRQNYFGGHGIYKLNSSKVYLEDKVSLSASLPKGHSLINGTIDQRLSGHNILLSNAFKATCKKKNNAFSTASWNLSYGDTKGNLKLPDEDFSQVVRERSFYTKVSAPILSVRENHVLFSMNGGAFLDWQKADAELASIAEDIDGNQETMQSAATVTPSLLLFSGDRFQFRLAGVVGFRYYDSKNGSWRYHDPQFMYRPSVSVFFRPSDKLSFVLAGSIGDSMPSALALMEQKRYVNYRTTIANPNRVEAETNHSYHASFTTEFKDVISMFFSSLSVSHRYIKSVSSSGYDFSGDVINYIMLPDATDARSWQINETMSKGFFLWNSKISQSLRLGTSRNEYIVGDNMHEGRTDFLQANLSYVAAFTKWLSFDTSNYFTLSRPYTDGKENGVTYRTFTNSSSLLLWPCAKVKLMPSVQYSYNNYFPTGRNNVFLNCELEYYVGAVTLSLKCSNLLDKDSYRRITDNGITRYMSEYRLRGRTLMLGIRMKLL